MKEGIEYKKITAKQLLNEFKEECERMDLDELLTVAQGLFTTSRTLYKIHRYKYGAEKRINDIHEYLRIAQDTCLERYSKLNKGGAK